MFPCWWADSNQFWVQLQLESFRSQRAEYKSHVAVLVTWVSQNLKTNRVGRCIHLNCKAVCEATGNKPQNRCTWLKFLELLLGLCMCCVHVHAFIMYIMCWKHGCHGNTWSGYKFVELALSSIFTWVELSLPGCMRSNLTAEPFHQSHFDKGIRST